MNPKTIVKLSNSVGGLSIILLIYWVFTFVAIQVFDLKVFRENMTETFYMSVLGILALMFGALIINIMFNLTRIAQKHNQDENIYSNRPSKLKGWAFLMSFPFLFGLLFAGDYITSRKKEKLLIQTANSIIQDHSEKANKLASYSFEEKWLIETQDIIDLISKTDKYFPHISIIIKDSIDNSKVLLRFREYYGNLQDTIQPAKISFIMQTSKEERDYLNKVFDQNLKDPRFSAHDGNYELYYPYFNGNKRVVFYFSDYQRYGKIGS